MNPLELFFALLIGHAFADFALQNDYVAKFKARFLDVSYDYGRVIKREYNPVWFWVLGAHSLMHAGVVWLLTGSPALALYEAVAHFTIDFFKCEGWLDDDKTKAYHFDQLLHVGVKVVIVAAVML